VSFLHDVGGLYAARDVGTAFNVVVLNNRGGRIFEQLPIARAPGASPERMAAWLTPHALELEHGSRLFGIEHHVVQSHAELSRSLARAPGDHGTRVVEICVGGPSVSEIEARIAARFEAAFTRHGGVS
jgi:2-succinyl-5-enolpyruvyl-6-hydroxy-3-cyclohexene-1-carboxylate synthase